MTYSFGDIYIVDFDPSIGHEYQGRRPAIVIQEENVSQVSNLVTLMPMTSQLNAMHHVDILMQRDSKNRLSSTSVIKVRHISSFDKTRFINKVGKAGSPVIRQVRGYLRRHFGL